MLERRIDKYNSLVEETQSVSRVNKNKKLYEDLGNKIEPQEFIDFNTQTKIDLFGINPNSKSRQEYQQLKEYQEVIPFEEVKSSEEPKEEIKKEMEKRTFDINSVLEEARKNRTEIDDLERKRKLKDDEYISVLSSLNKKYLHKKDTSEKEEQELKELIDTITSKTLARDLSEGEEKDLLSDLLATNYDIKLEETMAKEILETEESEDEDSEEEEDKTINDPNKASSQDNTFYTKSMELSDQDFEFRDEIERETKKGRWLIALFIIIILVILSIVTYFVLQHFGIDINL